MAGAAVFPRERVTIVGVLNVTPDSFSDGGRFLREEGVGARPDVAAAIDAAAALVRDGAHAVDVGGESTRPGAEEVPAALETSRVVPVVEALAARLDVPILVDTRKAEVAEAALAAGARVVNDVSGLRHDPKLAEVAAAAGAGLVLGHMRGTPATMQRDPHYADVLAEVAAELAESVEAARRAGVPDAALAVDPGLGFGKRPEDNLDLLAHAGWLASRLGLPVLVGPSRKSFLGRITGAPAGDRDRETAAACAVAVFAGAHAVRVHDVAETSRAVAVARALRERRRDGGGGGA